VGSNKIMVKVTELILHASKGIYPETDKIHGCSYLSYEYPTLNYNTEMATETLENLWSDVLALQYDTKITFTKALRIV
jgi:hypothetical protein